jgi:hypothetical protein
MPFQVVEELRPVVLLLITMLLQSGKGISNRATKTDALDRPF